MSFCSLRMWSGSAFQSLGAATEKALSPNVVNILPEGYMILQENTIIPWPKFIRRYFPEGNKILYVLWRKTMKSFESQQQDFKMNPVRKRQPM